MRKPLLLVALFAFFVSCVTDNFDNGGAGDQPPQEESAPEISLDDALAEMYSTMDAIYGPATRASRPAIAAVELLKKSNLLTATRSEESPLPEELVYVVNFEADEGFAVLGANHAMEPVYCITESGSLTVDDFRRVMDEMEAAASSERLTLEDEDCLIDGSNPDFVTGMLIGTVLMSVGERNPMPGWREPVHDNCQHITTYGTWAIDETVKRGPYLATRWHQGAPFNRWCYAGSLNDYYNIMGGSLPMAPTGKTYHVAGCWAIALAQVIAFNQKPSPSEFHGDIISTWAEIASTRVPPVNPARIRNDLAFIIRRIGHRISMNYGVEESGANDSSAKSYLKDLGYKNVETESTNKEGHILNMLSAGLPVFITGNTSSSGHAWVIDGHVRQKRTCSTQCLKTREITYTGTDTRTLYHCNFGWWNGKANGYYLYDVFNTTVAPVAYEPGVDPTFDPTDPGKSHYNRMIRVIKYSK